MNAAAIKLIVGIVLLTGAFASGAYVGSEYVAGRQAQADVAAMAQATTDLKQTAERLSKIQVKVAPIREIVRHEIETNTVYRDCVNTDAMMDAINNARSAQ